MTATSTSRLADPSLTHQELRERRAQGSLPYAELPEWVASARKSASGLTMLPLARANDFDYAANPLFMIVALCLLAMMSFVIFMSDPNAFVKGGTGVTYESLRLAIPFMVLIGLTFLCEWLVYKLRKQSAPETADIQVAAGDSAVVMLRLLPSMGILLKLELRFRERWCESANGTTRWHETDEYRQGLSFTQQSPTLAVVNVDIPRDAEGSYDSPHYKLEWILAITHQPRRSRPRTDEFSLWVTARSVFRSD